MRLGLFDGPEGVPGDTEEERAGNAKLIAEAPETAAERDALRAEVARLELERDLMRGRVQWLLEACKNELYGSGCSDDICNKHGDGCGDCCFDEMRRAVAKAEEKGE